MEARIRHLAALLHRRRDRRGGRERHGAGRLGGRPSSTRATTTPERYLIGSIEERHDDLEVMSPGSPLGAALMGHSVGDLVDFEAPGGHPQGRDRRHRFLILAETGVRPDA